MRRPLSSILLIGAAVALPVTIFANGSSMGGSSPSMSAMPERTPAAMARDAYNSGIDHRDKGNKLESEASAAPEKDRIKTLAKAQDEYGKALKDFQKAAQLDKTLYQALNGMGYAYRKTGNYAKALENYDAALAMAPEFPDAIEYRGEAYLALNRIDDAKKAYLSLFASDRTQATQLLKSMAAWVKAKQADPAGVSADVITGLDTWVKERAQLAGLTASMARTSTRSIWN